MHLVYQRRKQHLYKVLIIEDDEQLLKMYQRLFTLNGYESRGLATGEDALQIALNNKPHVILLDIMLPSYDGMSILLSLKQHPATKDCMVIMLTNVAMQEEKEKSYAHGADMYLIKNDHDPMQLFSLVHNAVKKFYN